MIVNWILTIGGLCLNIILSCIVFNVLFKIEKRIDQLETILLEDIPKSRSPAQQNTEDSVANGLVKGLRAIKDEDERHLKLLEMTRKLQSAPLGVMNQNSANSNSFDTGGDLIPTNLTKEEQEVLRMFYAKE